jgi:hypothetical protein
MKAYILVPSFYHMKNGMAAILAHAFAITKPLVAIFAATFDNTLWLVYSTVSAGVRR